MTAALFLRSVWRAESFRRLFVTTQTKIWLPIIVWAVLLLGLGASAKSFVNEAASVWPVLFFLWLIPAIAWYAMVWNLLAPVESMSQAFHAIESGEREVRVARLGQRKDGWAEMHMLFRQMQESDQHRQDLMQNTNQRFVAMLSSMVEGVLAVDSLGEVILVNRAGTNMLMLETLDVVGRKLVGLVRVPELLEAIELTRETGEHQKIEFKTLHDPKRIIAARLTAFESVEKNGTAIVFQDVTEMRALETMRRDFVANVSHELKTPLASIKAYAETLRLGAINDPKMNLSFVEQIETQADLLHAQILDLMEIARVESGALVADMDLLSLNQVCIRSVGQLASLADAASVTVQLQLSSEDLMVKASGEGLMAIVNNLVANGINYTLAQGEVKVRTWRDQQDIVLGVSDTGIGISRKDQERVFERFYRADKARTRDLGGTGLGLAIVKHTAQAFGAQILLESEVGKGTRFEIRFPASS